MRVAGCNPVTPWRNLNGTPLLESFSHPHPVCDRPDLASIAAATVIEGCIGETLAAALASAQLDQASDPEVRAALQRIADDEARHAELAWRTVTWALVNGGDDVRRAVSEAFGRAHQQAIAAPACAVEAHGLLCQATHHDVQRHTLVSVIMPCAHALLARTDKAHDQPAEAHPS